MTAVRQPLQDLADQDLGGRGAGGDADRGYALQAGLVDFASEIDEAGGAGAGLQGDLDQALGVGGALASCIPLTHPLQHLAPPLSERIAQPPGRTRTVKPASSGTAA